MLFSLLLDNGVVFFWFIVNLLTPLLDGVATVANPTEDNPNNMPIVIENKYKVSEGYSGNFYDINTSLRGGILYPALDPSIFEVKYPNTDIKGKVLGDNLGVRE